MKEEWLDIQRYPSFSGFSRTVPYTIVTEMKRFLIYVMIKEYMYEYIQIYLIKFEPF